MAESINRILALQPVKNVEKLNKKTSLFCYWLMLFPVFFVLMALRISAQTLADNWWQQESPEMVFKKSEGITWKIANLTASKAHRSDDPSRGFKLFQRCVANEKAETVFFDTSRSGTQSITYNLRQGTYFYDSYLLFGFSFPSGDEIEAQIASKTSDAYSYKIKDNSYYIGSNDCIVLRREMSAAMLKSCADFFYKTEQAEKKMALAQKHIRAIKDYYIRKNDGIICGYCKRSLSGDRILEDMIPDLIDAHSPISQVYLSCPQIKM